MNNIDYLIANELEALSIYEHLTAAQPQQTTPYDVQAELIAQRLKSHCIITRGAHGADLYTPQGDHVHAHAMPIKDKDLRDTTGAGDAFAGAFAAALSKGESHAAALQFAAYGGSLALSLIHI